MKQTIGRTDKVDFPELNISDIDIKVDTGAYTSSIHCHKIEEITVDNQKYIRFFLLDPSHELYNEQEFIIKDFKTKTVKNSFGTTEERYAIKTTVLLFSKLYKIDLTLSERSEMRFPILLGRKFLSAKLIVDTSKKDLSYNLKKAIK